MNYIKPIQLIIVMLKLKKKLIVIGDYDLNVGLKSFYHSYRTLNYGVQIALKGYIYGYVKMLCPKDKTKPITLHIINVWSHKWIKTNDTMPIR